MIEQQIKPWNVTDERVLDIMGRLPREHFVPTTFEHLAYADVAIPLGGQDCLLPPKIVARALQALAIVPTDTVLEIGTGTGYLTCLLANLAFQVYSLDIDPGYAETTRERLNLHGAKHVEFLIEDGVDGYPDKAPFDVIMASGAYATIPETLKNQLRIGGRLFVIAGMAPAMQAYQITRTSDATWTTDSLFECLVPYLHNVPMPDSFQL